MKVCLTWDYELYFGERTGTADSCMIRPTERLLSLAKDAQAHMTFFVDASYLLRLNELRETDPALQKDYQAISDQLQRMVLDGHAIGLHLHPHWIDCTWQNGAWKMEVTRYKWSDITAGERERHFQDAFGLLKDLTETTITSYRAGGWCIQPFQDFKSHFSEHGIAVDSSVFPGGKNDTAPYNYDFTNAPSLDAWYFQEDVCSREKEGFLELPIASARYSPLFFWQLYVLGRLFPGKHKPIGRGVPSGGGGSKWDFLTRPHTLPVNADGYFARRLPSILHERKKGHPHTVVIGHPKACTEYSLARLESLLLDKEFSFCTLKEVANDV